MRIYVTEVTKLIIHDSAMLKFLIMEETWIESILRYRTALQWWWYSNIINKLVQL